MKVESLQLSSKFHQNQMIWQYNDSQNGGRAYRFFWKWQLFVTWLQLTSHSASSSKIWLKPGDQLLIYSQKTYFQYGGCPPTSIWKIFIFGHVTNLRLKIWCYVINFIRIRWYFSKIWHFNEVQNGSHLPSWLLSRVSILTRDIDIANLSVRPSVRPSVCLCVRDVPVSDENDLTYRHSFFTIQ